jgi:DNA ligase-1
MIDTDLMAQIEATSSRTEKERLLKKQPSSAKQLLALAVDPMVKFGVTWDPSFVSICDSNIGPATPLNKEMRETWWEEALRLLVALRDRRFTGNGAKREIIELMELCQCDADVLWFSRILDKDLRCGVQASTIENVWPGLIKRFEVMLCAKSFDPEKDPKKLFKDESWWIEPKLDGYRCFITPAGAFTRNGRKFTTIDHIIEAVKPLIDAGYCLDGEVMNAGKFDEAGGGLRRKDEQATEAVYHVFDMIPLSEWESGEFKKDHSDRHWKLRMSLNEHKVNDAVVHLVDGEWVQTLEEVTKRTDAFVAEGYEGSILKRDVPYEPGRSRSMLKVKPMETIDAEVVDVVEGKGKYKGMLGVIVVKHGDVTSEVGTGFDDATRLQLWLNKPIGRIAECKYQNLTEDGRMRFPVFMGFRPDKE